MEEIEIIKQLVKSFNESRYNMWKHRILILNHHKGKTEFINFKPESSNEPCETNNTASRLAKNYTYSKEEFNVISIRAFLSTQKFSLYGKQTPMRPSTSLKMPT